MRRSAASLSLIVLAATTAGCNYQGQMGIDPALTTTEQFGIEIRQEPDRIQLAARTGELSPAQVGALASLAQRWRDNAGSAVVVEAPAGAQNAQAAFRAAQAAARVLAEYGVPAGSVVSTSYNATGLPNATVIVGFSRQVAVGPYCADKQSDYTATFENRAVAGFGCANVANFAAQLADPSDLLGPKPEGMVDAARRTVVLDRYRRGQPSGTPRSMNPRESADVGEAAQ